MTEQKFGCEQCGHIIITVSPDNFHPLLSITKLNKDCIKTIYHCDDCNNDIVRFWCKPPQPVIEVTNNIENDDYSTGLY